MFHNVRKVNIKYRRSSTRFSVNFSDSLQGKREQSITFNVLYLEKVLLKMKTVTDKEKLSKFIIITRHTPLRNASRISSR